MNIKFQEMLLLYKEGKLDQNEAAEIECEINKFMAISDYLNDDEKEFFEELKQQMPPGKGEENKTAKSLKRKVNLRIITVTALSVFSALVFFIFMTFVASKYTTAWFGLDHKEAYVKRATMVQLAHMFQPRYKSYGSSVNTALFAQQKISVSLTNSVGNTKINETEISVKYSFGKPVRSREAVLPPLVYEDFMVPAVHESTMASAFEVLEKAPQGTKAKILIEFSKALAPHEIKENFINQISNTDTLPLDITLLAAMGTDLVLANPSYYLFTPVYPYGNNNAPELESRGLKQNQFDNMDAHAHKESLIGNLKLIKNNQRLLDAMYYDNMLGNINIDDVIRQVENNGAEYIGMYISADSKELLKLKTSPLIHCMRVQSIVIW
jgi:hypothetical protein